MKNFLIARSVKTWLPEKGNMRNIPYCLFLRTSIRIVVGVAASVLTWKIGISCGHFQFHFCKYLKLLGIMTITQT